LGKPIDTLAAEACSRQRQRMVKFLFVPGAWLGGWCWRDVAADLEAAGHSAVCPTLTGLGERAHLLSPEIGLETHVADILGVLEFQDLRDVVLVGHSYGGTVITAVAEQASRRIRRLVYLDASVPRDGQSNNDVVGPEIAAQLRLAAKSSGGGWRVPPAAYVLERPAAALRPWIEQRLTPHPLRCFEEPVQLGSTDTAALPRAFLRTSLQSPLYTNLIDRAREAGWYCRDLKGGHYPMFTEPQAVAAALAELPQ
jgi:pimeloyl-ACP methyl ester carboxylesterase